MSEKVDVAVIIPTYNRASMLASAIEGILCQTCSGVNYELVVVDNNSNDDTRDVVESFIRRGENVRYLFEREQGVSHARNLGINNTTADILAFTDDDVIAPNDWVKKIKQSLDRHPDVLFVGGKVLPRWNTPPPAWLTAEHWSPLALVDYGDETFFVDSNKQVCLVTANLGVRRTAFDRFGLFITELHRCEDHEFELRVLRNGGKGLYTPELVITADVQNERLMKSYHRRWWSVRGMKLARFRAYDISKESGDSDKNPSSTIKLFGTPSYVYKGLLTNAFDWLSATLRRKESKAFSSESQVRDALSYIRETYRLSAKESLYSRLAEIASFAPKLALKKIRNYLD